VTGDPFGNSGRRALRVGVVGCGTISGEYLETLGGFPDLHVAVCADAVPERAEATARRLHVAWAQGIDELLTHELDVVVNLTPPQAHHGVSLAAVRAGRHVFTEKPLAVTRRDAEGLLREASRRGVRVASAPDTFFGPPWQKARALIDEGAIGTPIAARAAFLSRGWERWHPNPAFFYGEGAGPLLDMGPYFLTALVFLLGPVERVTGAGRASFAERVVAAGTPDEHRIPVRTPTHVVAALELGTGVVVELLVSFDVWAEETTFEIFGTEGTLLLPNPNWLDGELRIRRGAGAAEVVHAGKPVRGGRGLGVAELADALAEGREPRLGGKLAFHVLDTALSVLDAARAGRRVDVSSTCERPAPLSPRERELLVSP
jgi:predicted dehydrogenase